MGKNKKKMQQAAFQNSWQPSLDYQSDETAICSAENSSSTSNLSMMEEKSEQQVKKGSLKEENHRLKNELEEFSDLIDQMKKKEEENALQRYKMEEEIIRLKKQLENRNSDQENSLDIPDKEESQYGYDLMILMKSIRDLCCNSTPSDENSQNKSGLQIKKFNQNLDTNFKNVILVGMQGARNKGKTFLLNSMIDEKFPSAYHVSTTGIDVKYHSLNGKNIVYIDSEGLNCPIKLNYKQNKNYQKFMDNKLNEGKEDQESEQQLEKDIQEVHEDLKATEQIQQEFIIEHSNILIIVVSQLTIDDQRLIHQIASKFIPEKNSPKQKRLFVVHNLKEFQRAQYVKDYIEKDLKSIYPLSEHPINNYDKKFDDENCTIYIDDIKPQINHIVIGCQNTDAGKVYNSFALYYLKHAIEMYQGVNHFNVQRKLKDYLNKRIEDFVTLKNLTDEQTQQGPADKEFFILNKEETSISLKPNLQIEKIKELKINVFGTIQKDCQYSITINGDDNERTLIMEIPGTATYQKKFEVLKGQFNIKINQNKDIEEKYGKLEATTRKYEQKHYSIQICREGEMWRMDREREENLKNGVYVFVFKKVEQSPYE